MLPIFTSSPRNEAMGQCATAAGSVGQAENGHAAGQRMSLRPHGVGNDAARGSRVQETALDMNRGATLLPSRERRDIGALGNRNEERF